MANSTVDLIIRPVGARVPSEMNVPVKANAVIAKGVLIAMIAGMAVAYSTATSGHCVGVSQHAQTGGAADGDKRINIETDAVYLFHNGAGGDEVTEATPLGTVLYATDDHTIALTSSGGTRAPVGFFRGLEAADVAGVVRVRVLVCPELALKSSLVADISALTFAAVAGTSVTPLVLEALPDPTDSPATADALRDNIVAALLPPLRNNVADLATQINAIRTALRTAGIMA